jgi:hypothetical protein
LAAWFVPLPPTRKLTGAALFAASVERFVSARSFQHVLSLQPMLLTDAGIGS